MSLPYGPGILECEVDIIDIEGMGLSLPTENLVTVACRYADGSLVSPRTMAAVLVHELGHKIGMVPGPQGDVELEQQPFYYHGNGHSGPHCSHPAKAVDYKFNVPLAPPVCTMFGDTRTDTARFCPDCVKSMRKLDVSPERKVGIATQF